MDDLNQSKEVLFLVNTELFRVLQWKFHPEFSKTAYTVRLNPQPVPQDPRSNVKGNSPTGFSEQLSILFISKDFTTTSHEISNKLNGITCLSK